VPHIWSPQQVVCLLQAAARLGPQDSLRPHVYSTLLALLHVTGLRISEALALEFDDFDGDTLLIRETKFKKCRRIPLHQTAATGLRRYLDLRRHVATENKHLFISVRGQPLDRFSVNWAFRRLLQTIDLTIGNNGHRPRIHDLRHYTAYRIIPTWCRPSVFRAVILAYMGSQARDNQRPSRNVSRASFGW